MGGSVASTSAFRPDWHKTVLSVFIRGHPWPIQFLCPAPYHPFGKPKVYLTL